MNLISVPAYVGSQMGEGTLATNFLVYCQFYHY